MDFVTEDGRLIVRDQAGNRLTVVKTVGFYPYRVAAVGDRVAQIREVRFTYEGASDGDNHRVYKTESGHFVSASDWTITWGLSAHPR